MNKNPIYVFLVVVLVGLCGWLTTYNPTDNNSDLQNKYEALSNENDSLMNYVDSLSITNSKWSDSLSIKDDIIDSLIISVNRYRKIKGDLNDKKDEANNIIDSLESDELYNFFSDIRTE